MKRVFLIVLDSFGIGAMPDAESFGDVGVNTLRHLPKAGHSQHDRRGTGQHRRRDLPA